MIASRFRGTLLVLAIALGCRGTHPAPPIIPAQEPASIGVDSLFSCAVLRDTLKAVGLGDFYLWDEVTEPPRALSQPPSGPLIRYQGKAIVLYVIDTMGKADMKTYRIRATDSLIAAKVHRMIGSSTFQPARQGGRAVPICVEQPIEFTTVGYSYHRRRQLTFAAADERL
jgi:hypothetical protein